MIISARVYYANYVAIANVVLIFALLYGINLYNIHYTSNFDNYLRAITG